MLLNIWYLGQTWEVVNGFIMHLLEHNVAQSIVNKTNLNHRPR